jgi:hypothetical protein
MKSEIHMQVPDIVEMRIATVLKDAHEAQRENIVVDGNNSTPSHCLTSTDILLWRAHNNRKAAFWPPFDC